MILSALLVLACSAQEDVEKLRSEVERLKKELSVREAALEALRRVAAPPATPVVPDPNRGARQVWTVPVPAKPAPAPALAPAPAPPATPKTWTFAVPPAAEPAAVAKGEVKVTAVASEIGLVVLSAGKEDGATEGAEFTLSRGGEFVARMVVDRADRKWSAGKISVKKLEPRVGDDAVRVALVRPDELKALRLELDEVRRQVRALSDTLVPAWQGPGVALEEAPEELRSHLGIARGVLVRRVRDGSPAEKLGLKANDLIPDLLEAQVLQAIENNMPLRLLRQGRELTIGR